MVHPRNKGNGVLRRTVELPAKLRTELEALGSLPRAGAHNSRKERRKQLSTNKQAHSQRSGLEHPPDKTSFTSLDRKRESADVPSTRTTKKARGTPTENRGAQEFVNTADASPSTSRAAHGIHQAPRQTPLEKLLAKQQRASAPDPFRTKPRLESVEDREIAWLEAKLGMHRDAPAFLEERSNMKREFEEDGLKDLFEGLDELEAAAFGQSAKTSKYATSPTASESDLEEHDFDVDEDAQDEDEKERESDEETLDESGNDVAQVEVTSATVASNECTSEPRVNEPLPTTPTPRARYVPPHLRKAATSASPPNPVSTPVTVLSRTEEPAEDPRIRRQLLGHLNRLSTSNMMSIIDAISAIYDTNPRARVSKAISSLLLETISTRDNLGDQLLITYAALVSALSHIVGLELSAGVVTRAIELFDASYDQGTHTSPTERPKVPQPVAFEGRSGSKTCLNLTVFLAELYNFSVVGCTLVYDMIRLFISNGLGELDVELLLRMIKRTGSHLRQDDPSALKEIVALVKEQAVSRGADSSKNSRANFMLEMLTDVKNNKLKSEMVGPNNGYSSLKKLIAGLGKKNSSYHEPLRTTLSDIRYSSSRGKWWLVGAAWAGVAEPEEGTRAARSGGQHNGLEDELLKLARVHGMNTDVRRTIFVVLMSGEDYADACDRLLKLGLTDVQQREIVRVLLQCSGNVSRKSLGRGPGRGLSHFLTFDWFTNRLWNEQERRYNPYYTLVATQLAKRSHSFGITLQYCLWDFLRELGEDRVGGEGLVQSIDRNNTGGTFSPRRVHNLARLYAWCIAKDALTLHVLKPIPFATVKPHTTDFLQQVFVTMIISTQTTSPALMHLALEGRRDRRAIEKLCVRAASHGSLVKGLLYFLEAAVTEDVINSIVKDETAAAVARFGVILMQDTLSAL